MVIGVIENGKDLWCYCNFLYFLMDRVRRYTRGTKFGFVPHDKECSYLLLYWVDYSTVLVLGMQRLSCRMDVW